MKTCHSERSEEFLLREKLVQGRREKTGCPVLLSLTLRSGREETISIFR